MRAKSAEELAKQVSTFLGGLPVLVEEEHDGAWLQVYTPNQVLLFTVRTDATPHFASGGYTYSINEFSADTVLGCYVLRRSEDFDNFLRLGKE